ncbi:MAG: DnaK suppressor protein [Arenicella sp.]
MPERLKLISFSRKLNALKLAVLETERLANAAAQPVKVDQNSVGRLSRVDAIQSQAMAIANVKRQAKLLIDIERAFGEIESGEYGLCIECDDFIASARLEANLVTQTCIVCATRLE